MRQRASEEEEEAREEEAREEEAREEEARRVEKKKAKKKGKKEKQRERRKARPADDGKNGVAHDDDEEGGEGENEGGEVRARGTRQPARSRVICSCKRVGTASVPNQGLCSTCCHFS
eukprot:1060048-Pleurochrysis_carterae.AAC.2